MEMLVAAVTVFVLAVFIGFEIITKVPPTLHTPLMSGSNAISGITLVGALIAAGSQRSVLTVVLGFVAVVFASTNVVGTSKQKGMSLGYTGHGVSGDVGGFKNDNVGKAVEAAVKKGARAVFLELPAAHPRGKTSATFSCNRPAAPSESKHACRGRR